MTTPGSAAAEAAVSVPRVREVSDVDGLKAMADPIRLQILRVMMDADLPVLSVKELAEKLGEPQTKLYRHVRVLEAAGLIHVAATRLVSGIVEQRYQASQHDVLFRGPGIAQSGESADSAEAAIASVLESYRERLFAAARAGQLPAGDTRGDTPPRSTVLMLAEQRIPRDRAIVIRQKLQAILDELQAITEDPEGVPVNVLVGFFSPEETT